MELIFYMLSTFHKNASAVLCMHNHGHVHSFTHLIKRNKYFSLRNKCEKQTAFISNDKGFRARITNMFTHTKRYIERKILISCTRSPSLFLARLVSVLLYAPHFGKMPRTNCSYLFFGFSNFCCCCCATVRELYMSVCFAYV